ncbi:MAG TPA: hypothetical protein VEO95_05095, partial [Chthoniobacteraceae bacterium]|nr:hypothetical protein [Chthoniobacteraceae bacterium]
ALGVWMFASGLPKFPGDYWIEKARVALHYRDFPHAVESANQAQRFESRNPVIHYQLAGGYIGLSRAEQSPIARQMLLQNAVAACQRALALFPYDERIYVRLAETLDSLHRFREGGEAYQKAIQLDPNLGALHAFYARHLARVGRLDDAARELRKAGELRAQKNPGVQGVPLDEPADEK